MDEFLKKRAKCLTNQLIDSRLVRSVNFFIPASHIPTLKKRPFQSFFRSTSTISSSADRRKRQLATATTSTTTASSSEAAATEATAAATSRGVDNEGESDSHGSCAAESESSCAADETQSGGVKTQRHAES